jgi:hypothetical protein
LLPLALIILLIGASFYLGCQHKYHVLPPDLQSRVNAEPLNDIGVKLYPLRGLPSAPSSMAVTQSAIYAVINHQLWRYENESTGWENTSLKRGTGSGYVEAVAASSDGQTLYTMGWDGLMRRKENGDTALIVPQSKKYSADIPPELIAARSSTRLAVSDDGETVYIESSYPVVNPYRKGKVKKGSIKDDDLYPVEEVWIWRDHKIYTLWSSGILGEGFGWRPDALDDIAPGFTTFYPDYIQLAPDGVYFARQYTPDSKAENLKLVIFRWTQETGWKDYTNGLDGNFTPSGFGLSAASNGIWVSNMIDWAYWRSNEGNWTRLSQSLVSKWINSLLVDPNDPNVAFIGTKEGIYWTFDKKNWNLSAIDAEDDTHLSNSEQLQVDLITYHSKWKVPLVATNKGVYFVVVSKQRNPLLAFIGAIKTVYKDNYSSPVFWLLNLMSAYLLGITALLFLAWKGGSKIFARTALISLAAKPLLITPGLGRWVLFLGYRHRLARLQAINETSKDYFGLPAKDYRGSDILPDSTGTTLNECISIEMQSQKPVLIIGKGGAGKSTLLAQWAFLALKGRLPKSLKGFRPILVTASYYGGNLVQAITDTLRERDGVAVDEKIVRAQLQSGRFLVLFDGVSEVVNNANQSLKEILKTASNADYQRCRFLIASRPLEGIPAALYTLHLQPLTSAVVSVLLPRYHLSPERENRIRRQLQSFGDKPIDPLLFSMAIAQSATDQISETRTQLYERYFRRLLKLETDSDDIYWEGWRTLLEACANHFMIDTGKHGIGLPYRQLIEAITGRLNGKQIRNNLVEIIKRDYHLVTSDELDALQTLKAAGLLQSGRRWRFAHDTYEEYFAASYLVSYLELNGHWPALKKWFKSPLQGQEFFEIIEFINEMIDDATRKQLMTLKLPEAWKIRLQNKGE